MFDPGSLRWATTQSMAAMTWVTSTAPSLPATLTLTQLGVGGDADEVLGVVLAAVLHLRVASGDDPGHVGAVPEGVEVAEVRGLGLEGQVRAVDDPAVVEALHRRHTGVDEGHADALAGELAAAGIGLRPDVLHAGALVHRVQRPEVLVSKPLVAAATEERRLSR